jgi:penicillin-binding protein 1A
MKDQGYIDDEQYSGAVDTSLNKFINPTITSGNGNYSYYHEYLVDTVIRDLMAKYDMEYADAERIVYTKGLQIYSTMDSKAQNVIAEAFKDPENFPSISAIYKTIAITNNISLTKNKSGFINIGHFFFISLNFSFITKSPFFYFIITEFPTIIFITFALQNEHNPRCQHSN